MSRIAIVLFNLGGPDGPAAVKPFLFNLFNDKAIIAAPRLVRWLLAKLISSRRAPVAREIYAKMGGGSPILPNTQAQARALEAVFAARRPDDASRVFIAMRYWHPFAAETAKAVAAFRPDRVILLPLYPQYSTTTTESSLADWQRAAAAAGVTAPAQAVCCYPAEAGFVGAIADRLRAALDGHRGKRPRILFSAHGLPKKVIERGDPYQWQVEQTAAAVVKALGRPVADWVVCYQSRVGPLEWIGPSTDAEIRRAGADGVPVIVAPIAFVSEHSETLVELDIEYRHLAEANNVPGYVRVATVAAHAAFIDGLARVAEAALDGDAAIAPDGGKRLCPAAFGRCALKAA